MPAYSPHTTDEELVLMYRDSLDKMIVGELFKRHSLMCFTVCNKYLRDEDAAKDAAMQVFEGLFTSIPRHSINNFKSWLYTVCKNHCLMQLRKPKLEVQLNGQEENEEFFMEPRGFFHHEKEQTEEHLVALENAMGELNDKQRVCIHLFYLKKKTYEEISHETGYSLKEVKSYIQNGKRNLKITLNERGIGLGLAFIVWIQHLA